MACVNINLPIFKRLEAKFGFAVAEALSKQMGDIPTIEKAFKYIREIKMNKAQDVMDYLASGPIYEKSILMSKLTGVIHSYEGGLYVTTGLPETTLMEGKPLVNMDAKEISIKYPILFANLTLLERVMEAYPGLISYSPTNNGRAYAASINPQYLSDLQQEMEERDEILQSPNTEDAVEIDEEELSYDDAIEYFTYDEPFAFIEEGLKKITPIKKGVSELFESNPELASIGTPQQYSAYLDTIFPDSKVKDIVYRADKRTNLDSQTTVDDYTQMYVNGVYYTTELDYVNNYNKILKGKIYPTILNIVNPAEIKTKQDIERLGRNKTEFERINKLKYSTNPKDSLIFDNTIYKTKDKYGEVGKEIVVFEPEQIHILGSKQDIEGFKKFVKEGDTKSIVQSQAQSNKSELKSVNLQLSLPFDQIVDGLEFLSPENKKDLKEAIDEGDVPLICDL